MADNRGRLWDSKKNESSSNELTRFLVPRDLLVLLLGVGTPSAIYVYFERDFWQNRGNLQVSSSMKRDRRWRL